MFNICLQFILSHSKGFGYNRLQKMSFIFLLLLLLLLLSSSTVSTTFAQNCKVKESDVANAIFRNNIQDQLFWGRPVKHYDTVLKVNFGIKISQLVKVVGFYLSRNSFKYYKIS